MCFCFSTLFSTVLRLYYNYILHLVNSNEMLSFVGRFSLDLDFSILGNDATFQPNEVNKTGVSSKVNRIAQVQVSRHIFWRFWILGVFYLSLKVAL